MVTYGIVHIIIQQYYVRHGVNMTNIPPNVCVGR